MTSAGSRADAVYGRVLCIITAATWCEEYLGVQEVQPPVGHRGHRRIALLQGVARQELLKHLQQTQTLSGKALVLSLQKLYLLPSAGLYAKAYLSLHGTQPVRLLLGRISNADKSYTHLRMSTRASPDHAVLPDVHESILCPSQPHLRLEDLDELELAAALQLKALELC